MGGRASKERDQGDTDCHHLCTGETEWGGSNPGTRYWNQNRFRVRIWVPGSRVQTQTQELGLQIEIDFKCKTELFGSAIPGPPPRKNSEVLVLVGSCVNRHTKIYNRMEEAGGVWGSDSGHYKGNKFASQFYFMIVRS